MKEIEIKIKIDDRDALIKKVKSLGGKIIEQGTQYDTMYDDGKGFYDTPKVLRLRRKLNSKFQLTYKEKLPEVHNPHMLERLEIQTEVKNYEAMDLIIQKLGFFAHRVKEKKFVNYLLDGLKIEFHNMPFMGDFIEIESADSVHLTKVLNQIGLNVSMGINKDYSALFDEYCKQHNLPEDTPCTFEKEKEILPR